MDTRTCCRCGEEKPLTSDYYHKNKTKAKGFKYECKECVRIINVENKHWNRDRRRQGLTESEVTEMIVAQESLCLICQEPLIRSHVDHNHSTGQVRGILCPLCNLGLGMFKDSVLHLERAIEYLQNKL